MKVWVFSTKILDSNDLDLILRKNNEINIANINKRDNEFLEVGDEVFLWDAHNENKKDGVVQVFARTKIISNSKNEGNSIKIKILETNLYNTLKIRNLNERKNLHDLISSNLKNQTVYLLSEEHGSYLRSFWYSHYFIFKEELNTRFPLVNSLEDVKNNMEKFELDLIHHEDLNKDLPRFQQWYYIHSDNLIGPSKFIGYNNMNGILYSDKDAIVGTDGRDTEHCLKQWFVPCVNKNLENYIRERFEVPLRKTFKMKVLKSELKIIEENFGGIVEPVKLPILKPNDRDREFNTYSDELKGQVLYEHLIHARQHRWLDTNILNIKNGNTNGRSSANILYYLGMKADYRGVFEGKSIDDVIKILESDKQDYSIAINLLKSFKYRELREVIDQDIVAEKIENGYGIEGEPLDYFGKRYERNTRNRVLAIQEHGLSCKVCNFNFEAVYGEQGRDFIEVHHINPLSTLEKAIEINPKTDLVPLCSNCHRMVHRRRDKVLTIEELVKILELNKI